MKTDVEMRRKDVALLSFFAGTLFITIVISFFVILLPPEDPTKNALDWEEIILTLPVLRFCFILIVALFFIATDVMILRKYRVNYLFIFELDPHYKVTHVQLYRVAMMLLTILMLCFMGQIVISKLDHIFDPPTGSFSLALIAIFVIMCFLPIHINYLKSRIELGRTLLHIIASPFGKVKFKHFFLADILTSMTYTLKDMGSIVCFFVTGAWLNLKESAKDLDHTYIQDNKHL